MTRILVLTFSEQVPEKILDLLSQDKVEISLVRTLAEVEILIKTRHYDGFLIHLENQAGPELLSFLTKSRNQALFRGTVTAIYSQNLKSPDIESLLKTGVGKLLFEPINRERVFSVFKNDVEIGVQTSITPISCQVESYLRVCELEFDPIGSLVIESGAILKLNEKINFCSAIQEKWTSGNTQYQVDSISEKDLYYAYGAKYRIKPLHLTKTQAQKIESWIKSKQSDFVLPKTKALWFADLPAWELDTIFDREAISLYVFRPEYLKVDILNQIAPAVVLLESRFSNSLEVVDKWATSQPPDSTLLLTDSVNCPKNWVRLPQAKDRNEFQSRVRELTRDFLLKKLKKKVATARFLSRESVFSRGVITAEASLISVSRTHFVVLSSVGSTLNQTVRVISAQVSKEREIPFYGRVVACHPSVTESNFQLLCEWIPQTDDFNLLMPNRKGLIL
jgi:hypothetical protein